MGQMEKRTTILLTGLAALWLLAAAGTALAAPAAPSGLAATPGNGSVGLVWSALSGDVSKYNVYTGITLTTQNIGTPPHNWCVVTGLTNGTRYSFSVSGVDSAGAEGLPSLTVTAQPVVPPAAPATLAAAIALNPTPLIQLSWSPAIQQTLPILGYTVSRSLDSASPVWYAFVTAPAAAFADAAVTTTGAFTTYNYEVAAVDQGGNPGLPSQQVAVTLVEAIRPSAPQNLVPAATAGGMNLTWTTDGARNGGYLLQVADNPSNLAPLAVYALADTLTADVPLATDGRAYYFSLAGISGGVLSDREVKNARTLPPEVTSATAVSGPGYVHLSWEVSPAAASVTAYHIYSGASLLATKPADQPAFTDPSPKADYSIRSVNSAGESPLGVSFTAPFTPIPGPPAPTGFKASCGVSRSLTFSWEADPTGSTLNAYTLTTPGGAILISNIPGNVTTTTLASGLVNGQIYPFQLAAVDPVGNSTYAARLDASPLAAPLGLAAQVADNSVLLSWAESDTPAGAEYAVYRTLASAGAPTLLALGAHTAYADLNLPTGTYDYTVKTLNALGQFAPDALDLTATASVSLAPPSPPYNILLTPGNSVVQIIWHATDTTNSYNLYRSTVSGYYTEPPISSNIPPNTLQIADSGTLTTNGAYLNAPQNGIRYYYTLTSVNNSGESARSAEKSAIPYQPAILPADAAIRFSQLRRSIHLEWNASTPGSYPIIGYDLYRSKDGGGTFQLFGNSPTVQASPGNTIPAYTYDDADVAYGQTYIYRLHALDHDALNYLRHEGPAYPILSVRVDQPANRFDVGRNAFNPARAEAVPIQLVQVQSGRIWIKIYNLAGEMVRTLFDQDLPGGYSPDYPYVAALAWDGKNDRGEIVASGVYLIHAEGQSRYHQTRKVAIIK
jgi:large repetitive protein